MRAIVITIAVIVWISLVPCATPLQAQEVFTVTIDDSILVYDVDTGEGSIDVGVHIEEDSGNDDYPTDTSGFSFAIAESISWTIALPS